MSDKKEIKGGLSALFGGAGSEPQEPAKSSNVIEAEQIEPTEEEMDDLINSVEDEALRAKLLERREILKFRGRNKRAKKSSEEGYSRTSLIVNEEKYAKIKEIAFKQSLTAKLVVEAAFDLLIEKYEAVHGTVTPQPAKYKGDINDLFKK